jgi:hypothetical protein
MLTLTAVVSRTTCAWDVRTKNVTYEPVPTLDVVKALAVYGASATLFTVGPHHTVQQFDLNPPTLVANRQHLPQQPIASPATSKESRRAASRNNNIVSNTEPVSAPQHARSLAPTHDDSELAKASPLTRTLEEMDRAHEQRRERSTAGSTASSTSKSVGASSSRSSNSRHHYRSNDLALSRHATTEATQFSLASSSQVSLSTKQSTVSRDPSESAAPRASRLRQEVLRSPEQPDRVIDLFPLTRERLSDVPYKNPIASAATTQTTADLRQQMLSVVFGWTNDIESLIEAECALFPFVTLCSF